MIKGIIVKGIGGFYYVQTENEVIECRARGKFRKEKVIPLVGDRVQITVNKASNQGVIEEIENRDTQLIRPPVANVDQAIIVFAIQQPDPNLSLLDRFLALSENQRINTIICFNKIDLCQNDELNRLKAIYTSIGYDVIPTSTRTGVGIRELRDQLKNKISVFAGPSGVGKSSLLNGIQPNLSLKTGEISQKIERGKHTTRHVELLELAFGGWVVDTPGFSSLSLEFIEESELQHDFREFHQLLGMCKFVGCMHLNEPGCEIKKRLTDNTISQHRYESYLQLLDEIKQARRY